MIYLHLNFTSGFGDFYTFFCEAYFTAKKLKELGYVTNLLINTRNKINILTLFENEYYQYFDNIDIIESPKKNDDFPNHYVYYPDNNWKIGVHRWELIVPNNIKLYFEIPRFNLGETTLAIFNEFSNFPKFNNSILEKNKIFLEKNNLDDFIVIHFRYRDDIADEYNYSAINPPKKEIIFDEKINNDLDRIFSENKKILVCSNNGVLKSFLKEKYENVIIYENNFNSLLSRTYSDEEYLEFVLTEFIAQLKANKIYLYSNYWWITNFITYAMLHNQTGPINPYDDNSKFIKMGSF